MLQSGRGPAPRYPTRRDPARVSGPLTSPERRLAEAVLSWEGTMDDLKKKGATDRNKIILHEPWGVDHWTKELGVSKDELQKVIKKVGNSADAVRKELGR
jgi:hypothetical protein